MVHALYAGMPSSHCANCSAACDCASMRMRSVSRPFSSTQALNGEQAGAGGAQKAVNAVHQRVRVAPTPPRPAPCLDRPDTWSPNESPDRRRVAAVFAKPACKNNCPPPAARPRVWPLAASAAISAISVSGLDGVSTNSSLVLSRRCALPGGDAGAVDVAGLDAEFPHDVGKQLSPSSQTRWPSKPHGRPPSAWPWPSARIADMPSGGDAGIGAFKGRQAFLERAHRRVGEARIDIALRAAGEARRRLAAFSNTKLEVRYIASECSPNWLRCMPVRSARVSNSAVCHDCVACLCIVALVLQRIARHRAPDSPRKGRLGGRAQPLLRTRAVPKTKNPSSFG